MNVKISLAGDIGSGKSTISKLLSERLNARIYSTGNLTREMARKKNMTVVDFNYYMDKNPEIDREIDQGLIDLSDIDEDIIIDSRMAWHFVKNTFKVFLSTDINISAKRIHNEKRDTESYSTVEETIERIKARKNSEKLRYFTKYNVDCTDLTLYDFIIDTSVSSPDIICDYILRNYTVWKNNGGYAKCYMTYLRMSPLLSVNDVEVPVALDLTDPVNYVSLLSDGDSFYIIHNHSVVIYCINNNVELIPCIIYRENPGNH